MIKKCLKSDGFTILELMVSIFITITIIASFYKLYEASLKTERSSSIRVSVNLLGEQMLDAVAESIRMIGLNSQKSDLDASYSDTTGTGTSLKGIFLQQTLTGIVGTAGTATLKYLSPYGSPITKVSNIPTVGSNFPDGCKTVKLFNSAAFHKNVKQFNFHTQYGILTASAASAEDGGENPSDAPSVVIRDNEIELQNLNFVTVPSGTSGKSCNDVLPAGTLVTGEDFIYTLKYTKTAGGEGSESSNSLVLSYANKDTPTTVAGTLINFQYNPSGNNNIYSMPHFVLQFLREKKNADNTFTRTWVTSVNFADLAEVIAVRFGFVILSKKERIYQGDGSPTGTGTALPKYCIFDETDCYELPNLNYTASVFRRVVYLANFRLLKDSTSM